MKTCPYCGRENEATLRVCCECGLELESVQPVDPQLTDPALALVVVGTFSTLVEASVAKSRLDQAGIEACIPEEFTPQIFGAGIASPLERITVRVAAKDA